MYKTIAEIKAKNKQAGNYWFDFKTMRFFASKVESGVIKGRFFITSEKTSFTSHDRTYTIRKAKDNGEIDTIGIFGGFKTKQEAREYIDTI